MSGIPSYVKRGSKKGLVFRPHQKKCSQKMLELQPGDSAIAVMATGTGKSAVMCLSKLKGRVLYLCNREEICFNLLDYFAEDVSLGIEKAELHCEGTEQVIIASVQTLCSLDRLMEFVNKNKKPIDYLIVDECQHSTTPSYLRVFETLKTDKNILIGFTATPYRADGGDLSKIYDKIIINYDLIHAMKDGVLCNINAIAVNTDIDLSHVSYGQNGQEFNTYELEKAVEKSLTYDVIAKVYKDHIRGKDHHTIIYCVSINGCRRAYEKIAQIAPEEADRIAIVTSDMNLKERQDIENNYKYSNDPRSIKCLISCMVLTEGVDLPKTDRLIIARPTCNLGLYAQMLGRGTRLYPGKKECVVFDIKPSSSHKLVNPLEMFGLSRDEAVERTRKKGNLEVNFLECSEEIEEEAEAAKAKVKNTYKAYDLLSGRVLEEKRELKNGSRIGFGAMTMQFAEKENAAKARELEAYGTYPDFRNLHYRLGAYDSEHYIIMTGKDDDRFTIGSPNLLGKVEVNAYVNGRRYHSDAMALNKALTAIRKYLYKNCSETAYAWDEITIARMKTSSATDKQKYRIRNEFRDLGICDDIKIQETTRYAASLTIGKINAYRKDLEACSRLGGEVTRIEEDEAEKKAIAEAKGKKKQRLINERIDKLDAEESEKEKVYSFDAIVRSVSDFEIKEENARETYRDDGPVELIVGDQRWTSYNETASKELLDRMDALSEKVNKKFYIHDGRVFGRKYSKFDSRARLSGMECVVRAMIKLYTRLDSNEYDPNGRINVKADEMWDYFDACERRVDPVVTSVKIYVDRATLKK